ncbi:hypothetical protein GQ55_2G274800 [Panicum hallii var. hallii]|uniref:Protein XRI1 n=1 Tax=Panicum hallii var. hallii TaxID=1504633 RepID=A0A2T7ESX9_9POAL|nr:hypothetical protein GQ55_2G274800 [Panicum hallii var. hallii]
METAQEREVQLLQGRQAWPFHMMGMGMGMGMAAPGGGCFDGYGGGGGDCFVLGWEQQQQQPAPAPAFGCFGLLAADVHDLLPLFAGIESPLPVVPSSALAAPPAPAHDAVAAVPGELDDFLLNFWDASCHDGDVGEQRHDDDAFNSSSVTHEQETTTCPAAAAAATATNSFFHYDDGDDPLSSIFCAGPTPLPAEKAVPFQAPAAEPLLSSSSSNSNSRGGPRAGDAVGARAQGAAATPTPGASRARTPPLPRSSASTPSLKRATREAESSADQAAECGQSESSKRRRTAAAPAGVLCPFALLKPDGLDGGATLADINARILMRPARPVRHPVGEFACAPRVSADQPGISGKAVSSFTRLHTPGRGTITIIRTRG